MFRPLTRSHRAAPRRGGAILLTMFALIVLLMLLGLVFMMHAASEKALAERYRDAATVPSALAPDPGSTADHFFGTLIYDTKDDYDPATDRSASLLNALRGHSLARAMYGSRSSYPAPTVPPTPLPPWAGSATPWAGVGIFHEDASTYLNPNTPAPGMPYAWLSATALPQAQQRDRARFVNHTLGTPGGLPFLLDPEWMDHRGGPAGGAFPGFAATAAGRKYVGRHAGYTYPDLKNFFLGAQDPATGEVLTPSFHRDWLFRHPTQPATQSALDPNNPNWTSDEGRLFILRPRPKENPNFPRIAPDADGVYCGDVQNLPGAVGVQKMDSIWLHIGLPPKLLSDGSRLVQPMVAALILPLDGSLNLGMHGNQLGAGTTHSSYSGHSSWEVNLAPGLTPVAPFNGSDRIALTGGRTATGRTNFNQYNPNSLPDYARVAWSGAAGNFALPGGGSLRGLPSSGDPNAAPAYGNFQGDNASVAGHPSGYNPNEFAERGEPGAGEQPDLPVLRPEAAAEPLRVHPGLALPGARGRFGPDDLRR